MNIYSETKEVILDNIITILMEADLDDNYFVGYVNPDRNNDYGVVFENQDKGFAVIPISNQDGQFKAYAPTIYIKDRDPMELTKVIEKWY